MKIAQKVDRIIAQLKEGAILKYEDIPFYEENPRAVVTAVCRIARGHKIVRFARGQFYKPRQTTFGTARPKDIDLLKSYMVSGKKQIGYITGLALYNKWGLTTQIPNVVEIATTGKRKTPNIVGLKIKLIKPIYDKVTEKNIYCLQLLDVIKNIKKIPDSKPSLTLANLKERLEKLDKKELRQLEKIAIESYNKATCALLGALLETYCEYLSPELKKSINPLSRYSVGPIQKNLPNAKYWCLV